MILFCQQASNQKKRKEKKRKEMKRNEKKRKKKKRKLEGVSDTMSAQKICLQHACNIQ